MITHYHCTHTHTHTRCNIWVSGRICIRISWYAIQCSANCTYAAMLSPLSFELAGLPNIVHVDAKNFVHAHWYISLHLCGSDALRSGESHVCTGGHRLAGQRRRRRPRKWCCPGHHASVFVAGIPRTVTMGSAASCHRTPRSVPGAEAHLGWVHGRKLTQRRPESQQ